MTLAQKIALAVTAFALAGPASAVLITFEGQSNTIYSAPITRLGFVIGNPAGDEQHFHEITSTAFGLPSNGTGVLLNDRDTRIFVEEQANLDFSLGDVDVASATNNFPAVGLTVQGFLNGIPTGLITIAVLGAGYTTINGAALGTVDQLLFDGIGGEGGFVLDNLTLNEPLVTPPPSGVPEPGSLALLGVAFGALALSRRRRKE